VNVIVTASNHSLWRVLSNKAIWMLGNCWVDTPHVHTVEGDSVLSKLFAPHCHDHASKSNYVNRSVSLKCFSWNIFSTNELVDRIKNFKWNAYQNDPGEDFWLKTCAEGQTFCGTMCRRQELSNKMCHRPNFLTESWWVLCLIPIGIVCNLFSTNHCSEFSSFN